MEKNKINIYKKTRKDSGMTRDDVCDLVVKDGLGVMTPERLERIENDKFPITPEEVMLLSKVYRNPALCNQYCSHECPIGQHYVPEVTVKDVEKIILPLVASLNTMKKSQERLIEITADGVIDDEELKDFVKIQEELERISVTIESLQLWTETMIAEKRINLEKYQELKGE